MRRFLIGLLVLGLMVGSAGIAEAKERPATDEPRPTRVERTVEDSYGPYPAPVTGCDSALSKFACALITTRTTEAFFTAKVTDAHGLPVHVEVVPWCGGYGTWYGTICGPKVRFCGQTSESVRFPPGAILAVYVGLPDGGLGGWLQSPCAAHLVKTTGTIRVTLSNLPSAPVLRSGTIVGGDAELVESEVGACQMAPDCRAWLETGCDPALTERDPAATASIVRIGDLADGRTPRVFAFDYPKPAGLSWGGIVVQFWRQDCTEIRGGRWLSWEGGRYGGSQRRENPVVPRSAEWMTVSGDPDSPHIEWTLR